jgi:protein-tyrosine phosphatase
MNDRFGTVRGLVRLCLAPLELAVGRDGIMLPSPGDVHRLVFLCHGNICRSAFAEVAGRSAGLSVASFGFSTDAGKPAHGRAIIAAAHLGHDLGDHRATRMQDFTPRSGDLFLAMETRQLRRLAADARLSAVPRTLLGLYTRPRLPHLHDPYGLSDGYMLACLGRIATAMPVLRAAFPNARLS